MGLDAVTNFGYATLAAGISSSDTAITLTTGQGANLPSTAFTAVIYDTAYASPTAAYRASSAEIVRVTARSTDTGTILRAQEGTTARAFNTSGHTYAIAVVLTKGAYDQLAVKVITGTPMAALAIDLAEDLNTKTVSADTPLSFVATPVVGKVSRLRLSEGGGANRTITIPSCYSQNAGGPITSFVLKANAKVDLVFHYDGTDYWIFNDPLTKEQIKAELAITGADVSGVSITGGGVSGTWPTLTISGGGSGGSGHVISGGVSSTSFSFLETIAGGASATDFTSLPVIHGSNSSVSFS